MTPQERRRDAAHTLVVDIDADQATVDAAYERRLTQYINFMDEDFEVQLNKLYTLYDAREPLSHKPSRQWIAQMKLRLTRDIKRDYALILAQVKIIAKDGGPLGEWYYKQISKLMSKMQKYSKIIKAIYAAELMGIWMGPNIHKPEIVIPVYGAMICGVIVATLLHEKTSCTAKDLSSLINDWTRIVLLFKKNKEK